MFFNELEIIKLLKIIKPVLYIDLSNIKEELKTYNVDIYLLNGKSNKIFFVTLNIKKNIFEEFLNSDILYLDDLIDKGWISVEDLKEILEYIKID